MCIRDRYYSDTKTRPKIKNNKKEHNKKHKIPKPISLLNFDTKILNEILQIQSNSILNTIVSRISSTCIRLLRRNKRRKPLFHIATFLAEDISWVRKPKCGTLSDYIRLTFEITMWYEWRGDWSPGDENGGQEGGCLWSQWGNTRKPALEQHLQPHCGGDSQTHVIKFHERNTHRNKWCR